MTSAPATRAGHVAIAGAPNVGKSSLLNALTGSHLAIVSPKAQATRLPVTGLVSTDDTQFVLHDLPGLLDPVYALHQRMLEAAQDRLRRVQVVLHLHPAREAPAPSFWPLSRLGAPLDRPVLTVYTKADLVPEETCEALRATGIPVSAEGGTGMEALLHRIREHLPMAPFEFDPEDLATQPVRFFAAEYVREAVFGLLEDELPYAVAVEVEEFREQPRPMYIRVTLHVERDSQKGIVIGAGGRTLKAIGQQARARIEALVGESIYLECRVKVLRNWRRNAAALNRLGFPGSSHPVPTTPDHHR